jgi:hypothetical protein
MITNLRKRTAVWITCIVAAVFLTLAATALAQGRVVAIGDVHGAYPEFVSILQRTGLMDEKLKWAGGSAVLVQTGDVVDRGSRTRECLDLLMGLERQAGKPGGQVIPLLGNHEVLNIMGDLRYATADIFRTFSTSRSEQTRAKAYQEYEKFLTEHGDHSHSAAPAADPAVRTNWMEAHPPGYFEYRDALGPGGKYGAWLRQHPAVVKVGEGVFVHGGLNPALQFSDIAELDTRIRTELAAFDFLWQSLVKKKIIWRYMTLVEAGRQVDEELKWIQAQGKTDNPETLKLMEQLLGLGNWLISSQNGPLWYRGLAQEPEEKLMASLKALLARLKAKYIVEGHTVVSKTEITARFDNQVFLIDAGMLKEAFGGRAAALEIQNGQFKAFYADGDTKVLK